MGNKANGDLNGNEVYSKFVLTGTVVTDSTNEQIVTVSPSITETAPEE